MCVTVSFCCCGLFQYVVNTTAKRLAMLSSICAHQCVSALVLFDPLISCNSLPATEGAETLACLIIYSCFRRETSVVATGSASACATIYAISREDWFCGSGSELSFPIWLYMQPVVVASSCMVQNVHRDLSNRNVVPNR